MTKQAFAAKLGLGIVLASAAWAAQAQANVSISVGGILQPGVYGRVEIGNQPPPIIYPQPVIISQPVVVAQPGVIVQQRPIYMHVPPGHAKKWSKHCYKYNACNQPVYFVQNDYRAYEQEHGHGKNKHRGERDGKHGGGREH